MCRFQVVRWIKLKRSSGWNGIRTPNSFSFSFISVKIYAWDLLLTLVESQEPLLVHSHSDRDLHIIFVICCFSHPWFTFCVCVMIFETVWVQGDLEMGFVDVLVCLE